jgi:formiminotetrahydrofolate cyclodeaminase
MDRLIDLTVTGYLDALASAAPTPGGGSASALAAGMGAALLAMACNLTVGREKFQAVEAELRDVLAQATAAQQGLAAAVDDDTTAYDAVSQAYKLPKGTDAEKQQRTAAIQRALEGACEVPLRVAQRAAEVVRLARVAQAKANPNVASDAKVAELLARAGMEGAIANVEINLDAIRNEAFAVRMRAAIAELREGEHA